MKTYFISGIGTGVGKTIITGLLAHNFKKQGFKVITQKLVQTGSAETYDDIIMHRKMMGEDLNEFDKNGFTCPYIFKHPCSPHLAASMENQEINTQKIHDATLELEKHFDIVILEGTGGLFVPLRKKEFIIDYIQRYNYTLILISTSGLGSINHTLLSIEACKKKDIDLYYLIYNDFNQTDEVIGNDSFLFLKEYLANSYNHENILRIPSFNITSFSEITQLSKKMNIIIKKDQDIF